MSIGRTSGDVYFNPAYGGSRASLPGYDSSGNVVPLEMIYENTSFKNQNDAEPEFINNRQDKDDNEEEEDDIYKSQLLLFLKQNNLLKNSGSGEDTSTKTPTQRSSRQSSISIDSDSGGRL